MYCSLSGRVRAVRAAGADSIFTPHDRRHAVHGRRLAGKQEGDFPGERFLSNPRQLSQPAIFAVCIHRQNVWFRQAAHSGWSGQVWHVDLVARHCRPPDASLPRMPKETSERIPPSAADEFFSSQCPPRACCADLARFLAARCSRIQRSVAHPVGGFFGERPNASHFRSI